MSSSVRNSAYLHGLSLSYGERGQRGSGAAGQRGSGGGGGVIQLLLIRESEWRYLDNTITHNFLAL